MAKERLQSRQDAFLVVANHLKSKGADSDPLYPGDAEDTSSPANDQDSAAVTSDTAAKWNLKTIGDLASNKHVKWAQAIGNLCA